jgi:choice-of-anchor B domain-containing protein
MKSILTVLFSFYTLIAITQEQKNIELLDHWFTDTLITSSSAVRYSGCWGFTRNGEEYAIIGSTEGSHFFRLTSSNALVPCGFVEGKFSSAQVIHREFKTFGNYAYSVCDEGNSSLQIIDLSYLPDSVVKVADLQDERFGKIHNLSIDTSNALLFACLVTPISSGIPLSLVPLRAFTLQDPLNPVLVWEGPGDIPEVHDCYVRNNMTILNCGMDGLRVYDFTNPSAPIYKSNLTFYQDQGYNHQGCLSPDGLTYVFADETNGKRIKKCSVSANFDIEVNGYFGTKWQEGSVPHNLVITNDFAFVAHYNEGLRIYDIRATFPREIASYDTYTTESTFKMNGAWGVYSDYPSQRIVVSDRQNGLFLFQFNRALFEIPSDTSFILYPNPIRTGEMMTVRTPGDQLSEFTVQVYDQLGQILAEQAVSQASFLTRSAPTTAGIYFIKINYINYLGEADFTVRRFTVTN